VEVIPHGLDLERYKPTDRNLARDRFGLPLDRRLVLFGAAFGTATKHKGFRLLLEAFEQLRASGWREALDLVIFGPVAPEHLEEIEKTGLRAHCAGSLSDDVAISLLYAAADITVVPSIQEAFGQVAVESLACGTPVVSFNATGLREVVNHKSDGYLAAPFDPRELAHGIAWVLESDARHYRLARMARRKACSEFGQKLQAERYQALFVNVVGRRACQ
jgi:glycosyltransferase involved in cell wall biosynthesis